MKNGFPNKFKIKNKEQELIINVIDVYEILVISSENKKLHSSSIHEIVKHYNLDNISELAIVD